MIAIMMIKKVLVHDNLTEPWHLTSCGYFIDTTHKYLIKIRRFLIYLSYVREISTPGKNASLVSLRYWLESVIVCICCRVEWDAPANSEQTWANLRAEKNRG